MANKIILAVSMIAVVGIAVAVLNKEHTHIGQDAKENAIDKSTSKKASSVQVTDLHKDILRQISLSKEPVAGISPTEAEQELERRSGNELEVDKRPMSVKTLPFEIVKLISKSPASLAGIKPKKAMGELVRRYLSIDLTDSDDVDSAILLEALNHRDEKEAIEKWAKNEDAEAVEAFLKEEADNDPSSIANFAIGLKKLDSDHDVAMSYMDRYATHAHGDSFDNVNEDKSYKELIEAIKKLK